MKFPFDNIDLIFLAEAHKKNLHMMLDGEFVDCNSLDCAKDLRRRIEDTTYNRDLSSTRSDERSYYNGVLRVLRRRLKEVEKHLSTKPNMLEFKQRISTKRKKRSSRLMKLAGIL